MTTGGSTMSVQGLTIRVGDSYLSPTWAIVLDGAAVDLDVAGWVVRAQARDVDGGLVIDFTTDGTALLGTADVAVGEATVTTSTIRLYLPPAVTGALTARQVLRFDVEIENPTYGPLGDLYRVTVVSDAVTVTADVTRAG